MKKSLFSSALAALILGASIVTTAHADPLPGEVMKFQQLPLNNGLGPSTGGAPYPGHDEWSTARLVSPATGGYSGTFMADDFADNFNTPVVHVRWWGSYQFNQTFNNVSQFLISFETDVPFDPLINASRPGTPILSQVVTKGPLSPGSGTFTENLINANAPEHLYEYNAELKVPFAEKQDTVYWLKIVALVDPLVDGPLNWGWHDRDWALKDNLASPAVAPGENIIGTVPDSTGQPVPVWHFQDDAVSGIVGITPAPAPTFFKVDQAQYRPENYIYQLPGAIGIDGPQGIQQFSKDLAFELYTVPEPTSIALFTLGAVGLSLAAWKRRRRA
jgi:hypothetical protein